MINFFRRSLLLTITAIGVLYCTNIAHATGKIWQVVGTSDFSSTTALGDAISFAISPSGTPYVAYEDSTAGNKATVMKYDGTNWITVGSARFTSNSASNISLAIDTTGTPYILYGDAASSSRAMVKKFDGSSWVTVGDADFSSSTIGQTAIGFSPTGTPYAVYIDPSNSNAVTVKKLIDSTWTTVGTPSTTLQSGAPTLVFDATGTPYIAVSNISTGQPTIIKFDGSQWVMVGSPIGLNLVSNSPLAISSTGTLYVAGMDMSDSYPELFSFDGSSWNHLSNFVQAGAGNMDMAVSPSGTPYIVFTDATTNKVTVAAYTGSSLSAVGQTMFSSAAVSAPVLRINNSGTPYIAYSDSNANAMVVMAFLPTNTSPVVGLAASVSSQSSIRLSWSAPNDDGGADITGYKIERSTGGDFSTLVADTGSTNTTYTDTTASANTTYTYRVAAINSTGAGASATVSAIIIPGTTLIPVTPTATSAPLMFTINNGAKITSNPKLTLSLNGDPNTVRGYSASLDSTFANDSILPLQTNSSVSYFSLPIVPGIYTVYLRYYSTTGNHSETLQQTIEYKPTVSKTVGTPTIQKSSKSALFKRNLSLGSSGADVKALQQLLNNQGFIIAKSGVGSPGHETNLYGKLTATAVAKFQEKNAEAILAPNGLTKGNGVFGTATRAALNAIIP